MPRQSPFWRPSAGLVVLRCFKSTFRCKKSFQCALWICFCNVTKQDLLSAAHLFHNSSVLPTNAHVILFPTSIATYVRHEPFAGPKHNGLPSTGEHVRDGTVSDSTWRPDALLPVRPADFESPNRQPREHCMVRTIHLSEQYIC